MRARYALPLATALLALALIGAAAPQPAITKPDWLSKPTSNDLRAVWPAALNGREGRAVVQCRVGITGALEGCQVILESPPGAGVGAAALLLTPNFVMKPATRDGRPVGGAAVDIPINFGAGPIRGSPVLSLVHPLWLKAPSWAELMAAAPQGVTGHAAMRCKVRPAGNLYGCQVLTEEPRNRGLGHAAARLAPHFQVYMSPDSKLARVDVQVTVAMTFGPPATAPRHITAPSWRMRPDVSQATSIFPAKAAKDGVKTGRAVLDCAVQVDGALGACDVLSEDPAGEDFGPAAKRLTAVMALAPWTDDGLPVEGARIRVPVRLNLGGAPADK